jgi:hypothetical protein
VVKYSSVLGITEALGFFGEAYMLSNQSCFLKWGYRQ